MVRYNFEYERRVRAVHVGCGGHSFRNVLPCYRYAPIDLAAVVDVDAARAEAFARQFGASAHYTSLEQALSEQQPEAAFIVTGYGPDGRPTYPPLAIQAMRAGAHAWIEKPPAATTAEIREMKGVERETGRFTMVGFKKMFFPAVRKAREIIRREEFGPLSSIYVKYPQGVPPADRLSDPKAVQSLLDHLCHPASILYTLAGPVETLYYQREPVNGAAVANLRFRSGAVGCLHLCAGRSGAAPLERMEAVGRGANVVVENGCRLTYYRPGGRGEGGYGRSESFIGPDEAAPITWEPEFSLGQLYNHGLFLLGYAPEIRYFAGCVLDGRRLDLGGLDAALEITALYEAFLQGENRLIPVEGLAAPVEGLAASERE
jgi:predicted dehydrogenase